MFQLFRYLFIVAIILSGAANGAYAQNSDSLSLLRDFVNISGGYKQMPLYLDLYMQRNTNVVASESDTGTIHGEFFLREENAYVRFGEVEQIVNDSLALLVSDELKQMILFTDVAPVVKNMRRMMGAGITDSSLLAIASRYSSSTKALSGKSSAILLQSRTRLYGTELPGETVELEYDLVKKLPLRITTVRRSVIEIDSLQYISLKQAAGTTSGEAVQPVLALEGSYFLIREQITAFLYAKIDQHFNRPAPVLISDRIIRTNEGEYKPVGKYASYRLMIND